MPNRLQPSITMRISRTYALKPPLLAMLNMVCLNLTMKLVFCRAAMMAMKDASMTMVGFAKPPKAVLMSVTPNTTSSSSASSGGAPKGSLSTMIRMIMRTVTARAMIMGSVIERVLLFCVRSPCCARARPFAQFCCGFLD